MADPGRRPRRRGAAAAALLAAALVVVGSAPASGHAFLVRTNPAQGARLDRPPAEVALQFSEPVEAGRAVIAAQQRPHAQGHLPGAERRGDVIIGAQLQTADAAFSTTSTSPLTASHPRRRPGRAGWRLR